MANHQNAEADQQNTHPAHRRDHFAQHEVGQQRHHAISHGRGRLNVAVIGPGQHQHVRRKKPIREAMPSQIVPEVRTRESTSSAAAGVPMLTAPMRFIPFPSSTLPKGPKITIKRSTDRF